MAHPRDLRRWPRVGVGPAQRPAPGAPGSEILPFRFLRCPFRVSGRADPRVTACRGYEPQRIEVAMSDQMPSAVVCAHLGGVPHPRRRSSVPACRHPAAPLVVPAAERLLDEVELGGAALPWPGAVRPRAARPPADGSH